MSNLKITKAEKDAVARANAVEALGLNNLAQVSNTEYALVVKNGANEDTVVVVKLTVPKAQNGLDELVDTYEKTKAEKEAAKAEKAALKAEKIAQKALKAEKKKEAPAELATVEKEDTSSSGDFDFGF